MFLPEAFVLANVQTISIALAVVFFGISAITEVLKKNTKISDIAIVPALNAVVVYIMLACSVVTRIELVLAVIVLCIFLLTLGAAAKLAE